MMYSSHSRWVLLDSFPLTFSKVMSQELREIAIRLKIGDYHRHIFLCVGTTCCSEDVGGAAWKKLKDELKARNLSLSEGPSACYRTKVQCLRVCSGGPILVVYPEGYWYGGMTEDRIDRFIDEQILAGRPIEEWIFARNPLSNQEH
jgi:(2Fe-2S) ferredoxin